MNGPSSGSSTYSASTRPSSSKVFNASARLPGPAGVASGNLAFLRAQAFVEEFGLTHELICQTLDDCDPGGDVDAAARRLFATRQDRTAKPSDVPPEYDTWHTGP